MLNEHQDFSEHTKALSKSASRALGSLASKFYAFGGMTYKVFTKLYNSLIIPITTYGAGIWGVNQYKEINDIQLRASKIFLGLSKSAPNNAAMGDIGWASMYGHQLSEVFRLRVRLTNMKTNRLTKVIFVEAKKYNQFTEAKVNDLFKKYDVPRNLKIIKTKGDIKKHVNIVKTNVDKSFQEQWIHDLWNDNTNQENGNKLRLYRLYKERLDADTYAIQAMPRNLRQLIAKFRSGTLPIRIETGRYENLPLVERTCKFCTSGGIEDEIHVLLKCELYSDLRYELLKHMHSVNIDFKELHSLTKFLNIMTEDSCQYLLGRFLCTMMKRRRLHDN